MLASFTARGRFWRGNLHGHSSASDGALTAIEVCARYRAQGYDFISVTDHFMARFGFPLTDTRALRGNGFTTLLGAELHAMENSRSELWHILAVGLPPDFAPPTPTETGAELARRAAESGAFVAIPHPHWSHLTLEDTRALHFADAMELYNHTSQVNCDRGDGQVLYDAALFDGLRFGAIATDDSHFKTADAFGGWVMVKAPENTPEALLAALKAGHYYASQGPELMDIRRDGDDLVVACSPVSMISLGGARAGTVNSHGDGLTSARVSLASFAGGWCRLTITDAAGRRAWTSALWLD
ncbi:MAG: CehA/McbA family metallohydrolase [Gemmobacter sp.]|nr:CehA/McbA family metallohydrolase [Gemmobacter sp.]